MPSFQLMAAVDNVSGLLPGAPRLHCNETDTVGSYGVPGVIFAVARGKFRFVSKGKLKIENDIKIPRKH
jgi:hypothetical protein